MRAPRAGETVSLCVGQYTRRTVWFSVNRGARAVATPARSLFTVDSFDIVASVRLTQTADSLPHFDAADGLNAPRSMTVDEPVVSLAWVLPPGGERKCVWAELFPARRLFALSVRIVAEQASMVPPTGLLHDTLRA